jgi:hypothetical protein
LRAYLFGIAAAVFVLAVVIVLLRRRRLRERHAVWWLVAGGLALVAGVFPQTLEYAADALGIELPVNLVFFTSITILFFVSLQHSAELTALESKSRDLAESVVLLTMRVEELESQGLDSKDDRGALPGDESGPER